MEPGLCFRLLTQHLQQSSQCTRAFYIAQAVALALLFLQGMYDPCWISEAACYAATGCCVAGVALLIFSGRYRRPDLFFRGTVALPLLLCVVVLSRKESRSGYSSSNNNSNSCQRDDAILFQFVHRTDQSCSSSSLGLTTTSGYSDHFLFDTPRLLHVAAFLVGVLLVIAPQRSLTSVEIVDVHDLLASNRALELAVALVSGALASILETRGLSGVCTATLCLVAAGHLWRARQTIVSGDDNLGSPAVVRTLRAVSVLLILVLGFAASIAVAQWDLRLYAGVMVQDTARRYTSVRYTASLFLPCTLLGALCLGLHRRVLSRYATLALFMGTSVLLPMSGPHYLLAWVFFEDLLFTLAELKQRYCVVQRLSQLRQSLGHESQAADKADDAAHPYTGVHSGCILLHVLGPALMPVLVRHGRFTGCDVARLSGTCRALYRLQSSMCAAVVAPGVLQPQSTVAQVNAALGHMCKRLRWEPLRNGDAYLRLVGVDVRALAEVLANTGVSHWLVWERTSRNIALLRVPAVAKGKQHLPRRRHALVSPDECSFILAPDAMLCLATEQTVDCNVVNCYFAPAAFAGGCCTIVNEARQFILPWKCSGNKGALLHEPATARCRHDHRLVTIRPAAVLSTHGSYGLQIAAWSGEGKVAVLTRSFGRTFGMVPTFLVCRTHVDRQWELAYYLEPPAVDDLNMWNYHGTRELHLTWSPRCWALAINNSVMLLSTENGQQLPSDTQQPDTRFLVEEGGRECDVTALVWTRDYARLLATSRRGLLNVLRVDADSIVLERRIDIGSVGRVVEIMPVGRRAWLWGCGASGDDECTQVVWAPPTQC